MLSGRDVLLVYSVSYFQFSFLCSYIQFFQCPDIQFLFFYFVLEYSVSFLLRIDFFVSRYKGDLLGDACNACKQMRELETADGMVVMKYRSRWQALAKKLMTSE